MMIAAHAMSLGVAPVITSQHASPWPSCTGPDAREQPPPRRVSLIDYTLTQICPRSTIYAAIGKAPAMFTNVRARIHQHLFSWRTPSPDDARKTATKTREKRADTVASLQHNVRNIQRQISDLSDSMETLSGVDDQRRGEDEMSALHQLLAQKQEELSRYQARI